MLLVEKKAGKMVACKADMKVGKKDDEMAAGLVGSLAYSKVVS